jgi:radical SAM superfamily enzyme YgiQ (UPF0313 family)
VLGGYHASLIPEEVACYADSVIVGPAEGAWEQLLEDLKNRSLQPIYRRRADEPTRFAVPRRTIFSGKSYFNIGCVETGRGCPLRCNFCSIAAVTGSTFVRRPIPDIVREIEGMERRDIFFVDDNIIGNVRTAKDLFRALKPLNIRWVSQGTVNMAKDEELLTLMAESGCRGVLIGFESIKASTLKLMDKGVNISVGDYEQAIRTIHCHGLGIYGTFIFGYDTETLTDFEHTVDMAVESKLFIAAFNHLLPFPGTPLYQDLELAGRLRYRKWWLSPTFRFNDVPFVPRHCSPEDLRQACLDARKKFYGLHAILKRSLNPSVVLSDPKMLLTYFLLNALLGKEIDQKDGLPLGNERCEPLPVREACCV